MTLAQGADPLVRDVQLLLATRGHKLAVDGVAGPMTWDAIAEALGLPRGAGDPPWIAIGRKLIGTREIPGPAHNPWIVGMWKRLKAPWFTTDETPWCGGFVAHCLDAAGLPYPGRGEFARALSWASYGVACPPQMGAIGVKGRKGGAHVFFIIGETPDGARYKVLEGNANNVVRIGDVAKADVLAVRWPLGVPQHGKPLLKLASGALAGSEA